MARSPVRILFASFVCLTCTIAAAEGFAEEHSSSESPDEQPDSESSDDERVIPRLEPPELLNDDSEETSEDDEPDDAEEGSSGSSSEPPNDDTSRGTSEDEPNLDRKLDALEREVEKKSAQSSDSDDSTSEDAPDDSDEPASLDQQVAQLEGDVADRESSSSDGDRRSLNPEISAILDAGIAWRANDPTLVGGPDPKAFGPFLQSVELSLRADVDPFFTFESHLIAGLSGLKVGEAYGTTLALPAGFQARFGKFKTRFGRVNPTHLHQWHFTALPLVNGKLLGPAGLNGTGAELSQLLPLSWYVEWIVAVQDLSSPTSGRSFLRNPDRVEGPLDLVASGRLEQFFDLSSNWDFLWGLNAALGRNDSGSGEQENRFGTSIYATDLFFKFKPARRGGRSQLGWQTEAVIRNRQTPDGLLTDLGGYSYIYWAPNRDWEFGARYEYVTGALGADRDYLHPEWLEPRQRLGVAATYFSSSFSRFRLEYMLGGLRDGLRRTAHTIILQAQLVTGAHGAHKF